ncbi:RtcB family protein [Aggregicoccus sp. 17bor-14]|uniref:RtcB family protein n=1 Tax=Myxococcaceae TaxID=31 RepID=UPI00129C900E|nr:MULTISPECIES: RtcB family protein [Myxococcaceae]MBF5045395.1 RtcB family protein [Simulacricoccus sp. 17bor-14]MRI91136.1 RtcB family protein [Aggregicoccus sp. 17bor-14]
MKGPLRFFDTGSGQRVPVLAWAREVPPEALRQLVQLASEPYVVGHVAAMPDVHVASGVAVGTVFATRDTVVPGALGGDLGCGVSVAPLRLQGERLERGELEAVLRALARALPVGDAGHRGRGLALPEPLDPGRLSTRALARACERLAPRHLGTLGGGNHFLELDRSADGRHWLQVHTGSRGVGGAIAHHHQRAAEAHGVGRLRGLSVAQEAGRACVSDSAWALAFARANRDALLARAAEVLDAELGAQLVLEARVDVHHNFVSEEVHGGERLWVHRKGALALAAGQAGVIPGSMGSASYLVEGRGHPDAFGSCSHGAGRVLTRREARARIRPAALAHALRRVVHDASRLPALVEEAPAAYRDIREVLEDEEALVTPRLRLEPLAVLKG